MAAGRWRGWRPVAVALAIVAVAGPSSARSVVDATGRSVELPDRIDRILPAGSPAAVLIYTLAPTKLLGWPHAPGADAKAYLQPAAAGLPELAPLTSKGVVDKAAIKAAGPDLIIDVGTTGPRYVDQARQLRAETGVPTLLLDGSLDRTAAIYRLLGTVVGEVSRGEALDRILVPPRLPFGSTDEPPSVNRLLGLEWAGHALYPAIVRTDPRQAARAFYHLFYGVDLSDPQLDRLLASES